MSVRRSGEVAGVVRARVGPGSEVRDPAVPEPDGPEPVKLDGTAGHIEHETRELASERVERRDPAAPVIGNEQQVAELAEVVRCDRHSPGRVEPGAALQAREKAATCVEDRDPAPGAVV